MGLRMKAYIEKEDRLLEFKSDELKNMQNIRELLDRLKINASTVLTVRNGEVVLEDESLEDDDEIKILSVISGG